MDKFRNLTPHDVVILKPECAIFDERSKKYFLSGEPQILNVYPEEKLVSRCEQTKEFVRTASDGTPLGGVAYGQIEYLPDEEENTIYIVSPIVANAGRKLGRTDLAVPLDTVLDPATKKVVGCLGLAIR